MKPKKRKPKIVKEETQNRYEYKKGDRVKLLDHDDIAIVYKGINNYGNLIVFYNEAFMEVNVKRLSLDIQAQELYPEGYDLETLFVDHHTRKNAA